MFRRFVISIVALVMFCPVMAAAQDQAAISVEAELCTGVEERMPVGMADHFPADVGQVCLWTKVIGYTDTTMIKHVWYYRGDEVGTVQLPVRSSSWRTYSYKTVPPSWTGDWVVKVVDAKGDVLGAFPFKVGDMGAAPAVEKKMGAANEKKEAVEAKVAEKKMEAEQKSEMAKEGQTGEMKKAEGEAKAEAKAVEKEMTGEMKKAEGEAEEVKEKAAKEMKKVEGDVETVKKEATEEMKKIEDTVKAGM